MDSFPQRPYRLEIVIFRISIKIMVIMIFLLFVSKGTIFFELAKRNRTEYKFSAILFALMRIFLYLCRRNDIAIPYYIICVLCSVYG